MYPLDYFIFTVVFIVGAGFALGTLYLVFLMLFGAWKRVVCFQMDIVERRASLHKTQLVYPDVKGLLPYYAESLQRLQPDKLMDLYVERARLQSYPEFLQNLNIHTVTQSRTDNDLNVAANPNLLTGSASIDLIPTDGNDKLKLLNAEGEVQRDKS